MAFHLVATKGSFTAAAAAMNSSKAMISKQVSRLEAMIHTRLIHRTTRTITLTEEGVALFIYSQKVFDLSNEAGRRLKDMAQGESGTIKISAPVSLGEAFFHDFLGLMRAKLPDVKFDIDLSNAKRDLIKDGVDFAIRGTDDLHPDLVARYLGRIKDAGLRVRFLKPAIIDPDPGRWLARSASSVRVSRHGTRGPSFQKAGKSWSKSAASMPPTTTAPLAGFALEGFGVARMPLYEAAGEIAAGRLVPLFPDYEISTHPLYLVYLRSEYAKKRHRLTKDAILDWFETHRAEFFV